MAATEQQRCVLCPAGCQLDLVSSGPDGWRVEYPQAAGVGLCPRGSALGQLLAHPCRIRTAGVREGGALRMIPLQSAIQTVLDAAGDKQITILLDGNIPVEQLAAAKAAVSAWSQAALCLVVEPADEQLLAGIDAGGADYLGDRDLAECDGFLIIGDAFSANPRCSRAVLDGHKARAPIVVIDPGFGPAAKFATHTVQVAPGKELESLSQLSASEGGKALSACKRVGVLVAAEYGRTAAWRRIGYAASELAKSLGGGIAPQTSGANALAAVRMAAEGETVSLAKALAKQDDVKVAIGCDVLGMLGRDDLTVFAAAAALPNHTTAAAGVVLPTAMPGECGGTYLMDGQKPVTVSPLMAPPAGVQTPGDLVVSLARAAGAAEQTAKAQVPARLSGRAPAAAPSGEPPAAPALLLGRQAAHFGCGTLTGHASWQGDLQALPPLRISAADARKMQLPNLSVVTVSVNGASLRARIRVAPELPGGAIVLPEGMPEARALIPAKVDAENDAVLAEPQAAQVSL